MGFFDFLVGPGGKHLPAAKLDRLLREISALSPEEREYVKAVFVKYRSNGISKGEAERVIRELVRNHADNLDAGEVERIKRKLLGFFA